MFRAQEGDRQHRQMRDGICSPHFLFDRKNNGGPKHTEELS